MKQIVIVILLFIAVLGLNAKGSRELERYDKEGEAVTFSQEELESDKIDERRIMPSRKIIDIFSGEGINPLDLTCCTDDNPLSSKTQEHILHIIEKDAHGVVEIIYEELDAVLIEEEREYTYMLLGPFLFSAELSTDEESNAVVINS